MTKPDGTLEPAFILHARNYRDTSVILELFTRESGRCSLIAKGARAPKSRLRGLLEPFTPLLVGMTGRGEMKTATTIERVPGSGQLSGNGLLLGLYVNELLYRVLGKHDPLPELYDHYEYLLRVLKDPDAQVDALRGFELSLLQDLGYGINFHYDAGNGEEISAEAGYRFTLHEGFSRTSETGEEIFPGHELLSIAAGDLGPVDANRLRFLTRKSLAPLLGDRPLKSRALFAGSLSGPAR